MNDGEDLFESIRSLLKTDSDFNEIERQIWDRFGIKCAMLVLPKLSDFQSI